MTHDTKHPRRMALPAAAIAALLLAGCSSGHVGESWQCPLADAGTCDSVAAADPAVPHMEAARHSVLGEPLWRVRGAETVAAPRTADTACKADCAGFDPFAWLARLFAPETPGGEEAAEPAEDGPVRLVPPETPAPLPAGPVPAETRADGDDLRTEEVLARIWIAPFVDADGVYREASYVRVVLEPAGWRLAR